MKNIVILGGGLSGISTAYFLQDKSWVNSITIVEKENEIGGLCRTIHKNGYMYDIGPHILFSKDKEMLNLLLDILPEKNKLKRSNQIYFKGKHIQYPFENDLSKLPPEELNYCIQSFKHNPYEAYNADNMLQFFLKTFGEGITNTYLRPYNEKIWKYDPSFMNTSMVDRIPKPTTDEILRSASGETVDGYLHQLYFYYPSHGGIASVVEGLRKRLRTDKCRIITDFEVNVVECKEDKCIVESAEGKKIVGNKLISTIPIQELTRAFYSAPNEIQETVKQLRYNSIAIAFVKTPYDLCGEHFTFTIPDKDVVFHRISKMDFLGEEYHHQGEATYMVEVTYRRNDSIDKLNDYELFAKIQNGMNKIEFCKKTDDVELIDLTRYEYAYVIYDLKHSENMKKIRNYYETQGIALNGRFGNFEYWNMDRILRESFDLSESFSK